MEQALGSLSEDEQDRDLATLAAQMGRILFFLGRLDDAWDRLEVALRTAEAMWLPDVLSEALNTKALVLSSRDRPEESLALLTRSLELARDGDVPHSALRAYSNLSNHMMELERWDDAATYQEEGGKLAERVGSRSSWWFLQQHVGFRLLAGGRWDEMLAMIEALPAPEDDPAVVSGRDGLAWAAMLIPPAEAGSKTRIGTRRCGHVPRRTSNSSPAPRRATPTACSPGISWRRRSSAVASRSTRGTP